MKCHHDDVPDAITETTYSDGSTLFSKRQCQVCNETQVQSRGLPKGDGIQVFYDWIAGSWEPIGKRAEYEANRLAKPARAAELERQRLKAEEDARLKAAAKPPTE